MNNLNTARLILREWKQEDFVPFYRLNSDPEVMAFFPSILSRGESDELAGEIQRRISENGWGFWAVEEKDSGRFVGFVGLNQPKIALPFTPCVEIGWRLGREYWGRGYATEAACRSLEYAFVQLGLDEVVAFTAALNKRSESVMRRLGMDNTSRNFSHPAVPADSALCEHVLYKISRKQWGARRA
ncbi:GNAT family N-acetyltransferase [Parahaliea mediterranea]|uniref:GNAT family N-acetyltransferase n=1 Tax=Parahaliea mediterranea TaxID=651086 RepID=A0A939DHG1_9GAMM|nr:GNAT family N-acetyltransferase [Parahaliea mediterranea]MBN7798319.1 GNAT family N-acetyltransferase [Parahaliea mediterranea]